ncbi:hypothetical protein Dimus_039764 [Dionaea muscipula]
MLRKYVSDPSHVIEWGDLAIDDNASFEERPVRILDRRDKVLRGKIIPLVKILWQHFGTEEATWREKQTFDLNIQSFFHDKVCFEFQNEILLRRVGCRDPNLMNIIKINNNA